MKKILRVGVLNNFNFTTKEIRAVKALQFWGYHTFVNSNSHIPIKAEAGSAMITINPDLDKFVEPIGEIQNIKAVRVKYVANPKKKVGEAWRQSLQWAQDHNIPVLVTPQRFVRKSTMKKYTLSDVSYVFKKGYLRLREIPQSLDGMNVCDRKGLGCPSCQLCATLTCGFKGDIQGINLGESGVCKFNCPDCFAKRCLMNKAPKFGVINKNKKMEGYK